MAIDADAQDASPGTLAAARAEFDADVTDLDTTQAVGWLPVNASRFAYSACGGYKWLLSPRGRLLHHQSRADRRPDTALRRLVCRR